MVAQNDFQKQNKSKFMINQINIAIKIEIGSVIIKDIDAFFASQNLMN